MTDPEKTNNETDAARRPISVRQHARGKERLSLWEERTIIALLRHLPRILEVQYFGSEGYRLHQIADPGR